MEWSQVQTKQYLYYTHISLSGSEHEHCLVQLIVCIPSLLFFPLHIYIFFFTFAGSANEKEKMYLPASEPQWCQYCFYYLSRMKSCYSNWASNRLPQWTLMIQLFKPSSNWLSATKKDTTASSFYALGLQFSTYCTGSSTSYTTNLIYQHFIPAWYFSVFWVLQILYLQTCGSG